MREGRGLRDGAFFFGVVTMECFRTLSGTACENMRLRDCNLDDKGRAITTDGRSQNPSGWRGFVFLAAAFLALTAALCTVFALVVTAVQAWGEHTQAQWPEVTARVQRCGLKNYVGKWEWYWIDCSLSYTVRGEEIVSHVRSRNTAAPRRIIVQYPPGQFELLQEWVDEHPEGTAIAVHYDPANRKKAVLVATDMPGAGPRTPNNLKLLGFCAVSCAVMLGIARAGWPRTAGVN